MSEFSVPDASEAGLVTGSEGGCCLSSWEKQSAHRPWALCLAAEGAGEVAKTLVRLCLLLPLACESCLAPPVWLRGHCPSR